MNTKISNVVQIIRGIQEAKQALIEAENRNASVSECQKLAKVIADIRACLNESDILDLIEKRKAA